MWYEEQFTFSVQVGYITSVEKSTLGGLPKNTNFRPMSMIIEATGAYVPGKMAGTTPIVGFFAPAAVQAWFCENGAKNATTRVLPVGPHPRKIHLKWPRSGDWFSYDINSDSKVAEIEAVCIGPVGDSSQQGYIRGTVRMKIQLSHELIAPACPTLLTNTYKRRDDDEDSQLSSFNSLKI